MIIYLGQIKLKAYKYQKPVMTNNKGRIWESRKIRIDKKLVVCNFDSKHGNYIHFEYRGSQYRLAVSGEYYEDAEFKVNKYSFNPLTEEVHFSTSPFSFHKKH